jgi:hypothetical protein
MMVGMRWKPHVDKEGRPYPLHDLHPFRQTLTLPALKERREQLVTLHVNFGLHTFTRKWRATDDDRDLYKDDREQPRTFDHERYKYAPLLRATFKDLGKHRIEHALSNQGRKNYVTIQVPEGTRYAAFFDVRRLRELGASDIEVFVISAYPMDEAKPHPGKERVTLNAILGYALRDSRPPRP